MLISGFSYIRNGFQYDYPFLQSIQSILPICDEFVIAIGDSTDGTREAVAQLDPNKIKIIDTVWDDKLRQEGKIFAQQANIALDQISGEWGFHIQADEVIHEKDLPRIKENILKYKDNSRVEGFLLRFLNFCGDYYHIGTTRSWHRYEIRIIRNRGYVRSYRDSQGFRRFQSPESYTGGEEKGDKLKVIGLDIPVYHYSYVRSPKDMKKKSDYFQRFWHDDGWLDENIDNKRDEFEFSGELDIFDGEHPKIMDDCIKAVDWEFRYDSSRVKHTLKAKILGKIEKQTGWRIGEYKNYIRIG